MAEPTPPAGPTQETSPGLSYTLPPKALKIIQDIEIEKSLPPGSLMGLYAAENSGQPSFRDSMLAESPTHARGPFQLTHDALKDIGRDPKTFKWNSLRENALGAADYATKLLDYTKDLPLPAPLRIAGAYNMGPTRLREGIQSGEIAPTIEGIDAASEKIGNGRYISKFQRATPIEMVSATGAASPAQNPASRLSLIQQEDEKYAGGPVTAQTGLRALPEMARATATGAWDNIIKPTLASITQFPNELGQNLAAPQANEAMAEQWPPSMGPPPTVPEPPTVDPMGAVNFGATIMLPGAGRLANAGATFGISVLNAADAAAREEAAQQGIDWEGTPILDRLNRTAHKFNYDTMADNLPMILGGTLLSGLLAPKGAYQGKVTAAKGAATAAWDTAKQHVDEANAPIIARTEQRSERDMWQWAIAEKGKREGVELYNADQALLRKADEEGAQAYATAKLATDQKVARAEGLTGLKRLPADDAAWELAVQEQNQKARDFLLNSTGLGPADSRLEDPSGKVFQKWLGTWDAPTPAALQEIPDKTVKEINRLLDKVTKEGKASGRAAGPLSKLPRLGDPKLSKEINVLEAQIHALPEGHASIPSLFSKLTALYDQQKPVTIKETIDLVQNIEAGSRTKLFSDAATSRDKSLLSDLSQKLRATGGPIERALGPEDAAQWRGGNVLSKDWSEKRRITDMVSDAFMDIKPGAATVRNNLYAGKEKFTRTLGPAKYARLYDLAGAVDDLYLKIPAEPKPKAGALKTYTSSLPPVPRTPQSTRGFRPEPAPLGPREWEKYMEGQRAADFVRGMNRLFEHTQTHALWSVAAGTVAAGYAAGRGHQDVGTSAVIGGSVLGAMIAIPTFGRAFATAIRHFDRPESRTYLQAVAKMVTIAQMHGAYTGRQPAPETAPEPAAVRPVEPPTRMAAPNLPSRPTGVRVPAPSPSRTPSFPTFPGSKVLQ